MKTTTPTIFEVKCELDRFISEKRSKTEAAERVYHDARAELLTALEIKDILDKVPDMVIKVTKE